MKLLSTAAVLALALSTALTCTSARAQDAAGAGATKSAPPAKSITTSIINADGQTVGTATFAPAANGVRITLDIKKLPPGPHLMHIHEHAKCDAPDFKTAGAHFNPTDPSHSMGSMGSMAGDIPHFELTVAENGTAHTSVIAPGVTMGDAPNSIFTNGGTSLVIHEVAKTVGDAAPPRIACAVIARSK
jgi:superoxide dismutase, Cu-Zn family